MTDQVAWTTKQLRGKKSKLVQQMPGRNLQSRHQTRFQFHWEWLPSVAVLIPLRNLEIAVVTFVTLHFGKVQKYIIFLYFVLIHSVALHFPMPVPLKGKVLHAHRVGDRVAGCGRPVQPWIKMDDVWKSMKYGYSLKNSLVRGSGFQPSKRNKIGNGHEGLPSSSFFVASVVIEEQLGHVAHGLATVAVFFKKLSAQNRVPHKNPLILAGSIFGAPPNHFSWCGDPKLGALWHQTWTPLEGPVSGPRSPGESPCARNMSVEITTRAHGFGAEIQGRPPKPCPVLMHFEGSKPDPQIARLLGPDEMPPPNTTPKNGSQCNETPTLVSWSNRCLVVWNTTLKIRSQYNLQSRHQTSFQFHWEPLPSVAVLIPLRNLEIAVGHICNATFWEGSKKYYIFCILYWFIV